MSAVGRCQLEAAAQSAHAVPRLIGATDWAAIELIYDALLAILGVDSLSVAGGCFYFASLLTPTPLRRTEVQPHKILKNLLERDQEGHLAITDFGLRILKSLINLNAEGEERDDKFDRVFCARRGPPKDTLLSSPSAPGPTLADHLEGKALIAIVNAGLASTAGAALRAPGRDAH